MFTNIVCLIYIVETEKGIFDAIMQGEIDFDSDPWPLVSDSAKDLVRKMLMQDPKKRITSAQVLGSNLPFCYSSIELIEYCMLESVLD